jgi:hypothetical protein
MSFHVLVYLCIKYVVCHFSCDIEIVAECSGFQILELFFIYIVSPCA